PSLMVVGGRAAVRQPGKHENRKVVVSLFVQQMDSKTLLGVAFTIFGAHPSGTLRSSAVTVRRSCTYSSRLYELLIAFSLNVHIWLIRIASAISLMRTRKKKRTIRPSGEESSHCPRAAAA